MPLQRGRPHAVIAGRGAGVKRRVVVRRDRNLAISFTPIRALARDRPSWRRMLAFSGSIPLPVKKKSAE